MKNTFARSIALGLGVVLVATMGLVSGSTATAGSSTTTTASRGIVAQSSAGTMKSFLEGRTANGRDVTGKFTPLHFSRHNGHLRARGLIQGVVHNADGSTKTFSVLRTLRVRSINGTTDAAARTASARATCPILHLVLGPLDLDLLGLQVHLDRVVLNIDAESGPGNLLGNLLCAVAGLLDPNGTLQGLLGQLTTLLNQILGRLGLGL